MPRIRKSLDTNSQLTKEEMQVLKDVLKQDTVFQDLPLNLLNVDYSYQTRPRERLIQAIARNLIPMMLQTFIVGQRPDGTYWVCDGVTRKLGLETRGERNRIVRCQVLQTKGRAQEALLFKFINGTSRKTVPLASRLQAEGIAGTDHGFLNLVEECGFTIVGQGKHALKGLGFIYEEFGRNPNALKKALFALKATWAASGIKLDGTMIAGVARLYSVGGNDAETRRLLDRTPPAKLEEFIMNAWGGGTSAKMRPKIHPGERPRWIAKTMARLLNKKREPKIDVSRIDDLDEAA